MCALQRSLTNKVSYLTTAYILIVRKNMQTIIAERLKTVTFELRRMEKDHYAKVQELHGSSADTRQSDELLVQEYDEETKVGYKGSEV